MKKLSIRRKQKEISPQYSIAYKKFPFALDDSQWERLNEPFSSENISFVYGMDKYQQQADMLGVYAIVRLNDHDGYGIYHCNAQKLLDVHTHSKIRAMTHVRALYTYLGNEGMESIAQAQDNVMKIEQYLMAYHHAIELVKGNAERHIDREGTSLRSDTAIEWIISYSDKKWVYVARYTLKGGFEVSELDWANTYTDEREIQSILAQLSESDLALLERGNAINIEGETAIRVP